MHVMILAHRSRLLSMGAFDIRLDHELPSTSDIRVRKIFATHGSTVRSLSYDLRYKPVSLEEANLGSELAICM